MVARIARELLVLLDVFIGVTGMGGGIAVATGVDPFPPEWLVGEVLILNQPVEPTPIEVIFFGMGAVMAVLGRMIGRSEIRAESSPA